MNKIISVNQLVISQEAKDNVNEALDSNWISSSGKFVKEFEDKFAEWLGVKHAIAVSSGTASLHIALRTLGIGKGDEVIVPAFTMGSSWLAILYTGATPIFVDVDLKNWTIDVEQIESKITRNTKAIMVVNMYGQPPNMGVIMDIAKKHNLKIVEDACEGLGAMWRDKKCGTFGDINCFSTFSNKIVSTGEGGMVVTDNDEYAKKLRELRNLCFTKTRFIHNDIGYNYRMTNLQAAIGCGEMEHIEEYIEKKLAMANVYNEILGDINGIRIPIVIRGTDNIYWMYGIIVDKMSFGMSRDELRKELRMEYFIDTRDFFYPPEYQPILKDDNVYIHSRYLARNGMYLPSGLGTSLEDFKYIANIIKEIQMYGKRDIIKQENWNLERFKKNPIILQGHNYNDTKK